jgi:hypothetical protein
LLKCNGTNNVKIKTIHGQFVFPLQKYLVKGKSCHYFDLTSQFSHGYFSPLLQELVAYYSNRLSYQEVEKLVKRVTGQRLISDQKIWEIIVNKAVEVSENWHQDIQKSHQKTQEDIKIKPLVDIYDPESDEILLFDDGIGVKKQKENRHSRQADGVEKNEKIVKQTKTMVFTDVILLETQKGQFEYLTSPIDHQGNPLIPLEQVVKSKIHYYYPSSRKFLPIVAITDGASSIRKRLNNLCNKGITLILDWYHLCKKVRDFLSMIARNKLEKQEHCRWLLSYLWRGDTAEAMYYLTTKIRARNEQKLLDLLTYFSKHEYEIINYERRRQAGKSIGSGRMEKGVDLVIGHRQKHKGMSWSSLGSKALAILKVVELNGQWQQLWFPQTAI